jgi:hypothetical protein
MGLGKRGRLRVDQPTITGELGPAPDAYTHYSPVMIAALSKTAGRSAFDEGGPFFLRQAGGSHGDQALEPPRGVRLINQAVASEQASWYSFDARRRPGVPNQVDGCDHWVVGRILRRGCDGDLLDR